jgi:hypothetical protein
MNSFRAEWPNLLKEPDSELSKGEKVKLDGIVQMLQTLLPAVDPENKARLIQWAIDNCNDMKLLFGAALEFDMDALMAYVPPEPEAAGGTAKADSEFNEADHPRDADGKFGSGGGSPKLHENGYSAETVIPAPKNSISPSDIVKANRRGLNSSEGDFESYYTPVLQIAYNLGKKKKDLSKAKIVTGIRYGLAPETGISQNFTEGTSEEGLSLAQVQGSKEVGSSMWFKDRKAYEYRGIESGKGSDGETLILPLHVDNWDA